MVRSCYRLYLNQLTAVTTEGFPIHILALLSFVNYPTGPNAQISDYVFIKELPRRTFLERIYVSVAPHCKHCTYFSGKH